jgi:hypothetical protein
MNIARLRSRVASGFKPFVLRMSDGRDYPVTHPECILIADHSLAVLDEDREIITLDPLHIVAIKNLPVKKNGTRKL